MRPYPKDPSHFLMVEERELKSDFDRVCHSGTCVKTGTQLFDRLRKREIFEFLIKSLIYWLHDFTHIIKSLKFGISFRDFALRF